MKQVSHSPFMGIVDDKKWCPFFSLGVRRPNFLHPKTAIFSDFRCKKNGSLDARISFHWISSGLWGWSYSWPVDETAQGDDRLLSRVIIPFIWLQSLSLSLPSGWTSSMTHSKWQSPSQQIGNDLSSDHLDQPDQPDQPDQFDQLDQLNQQFDKLEQLDQIDQLDNQNNKWPNSRSRRRRMKRMRRHRQ